MVYTVRNCCVEDTTVDYNDGATKIFLYTRGTAGNPSQELKDMLKYIEKSTNDNITNQDIASISKMVDKVKHKKEVDLNYMKSWEYEEWIKDEAFKDGFSDGSAQMSQLILCLTEAGRIDDLTKAASDVDFRNQLLKELGIGK